MSDIDDLRADLDAARADLLASFEGIAQDEFARRPPPEDGDGAGDPEERWPVRDILWHAGLLEDWLRRVVDEGVSGRPISRYEARRRPAIANTPDYLREWLEQSRRPVLSLLGRLPADALDREFTLPEEEVRTARRLLAHIAQHDREHAEQVRALRALPAPEER
ncbi:MAG: DinB family protein [Dehalococcoidia bacterium]